MRRHDGHVVRYEPTSVTDLLVEMKDTAELLIDLPYSAVLHNSPMVTHEVIELEHRTDVLQMQARMSLLLAARTPNEAETLTPVLGVVAAADEIVDAAGDIVISKGTRSSATEFDALAA